MADEKTKEKTAVALGNFDGMHVGHMAVIKAAKSYVEKGLTPIAVLFDEHSKKTLVGNSPPMLMPTDERDGVIIENGLKIEKLVFNEIKNLSPRDFVEQILVARFGACVICCGYNYRFGKDAEGTAQTMREICAQLGISCEIIGEVDVDAHSVSSTEIRELIKTGKIRKANQMLGRKFGFSARVIDGDKRGRKLGFPTINQEIPKGLVLPKFGVYETVITVDGRKYKGITNIGKRPTVGTEKILSETYIIDFDDDAYGKNADVRLVRFIRPEKRFESYNELVHQIEADIKEVL